MRKICLFSFLFALLAFTSCDKKELRVTGVSLNKTTLTLAVDAEETLVATVEPEKAQNKAVSWASDADAVATVDDNGKVTAHTVGTANITVTTADGEKTAVCAVTVTQDGAPPVPVAGVSLNKATLSLKVGGDETLFATVLPETATNKAVSWASDADAVAKVEANGKVTALAAGTAKITVTTADGEKTAVCAVTVTEPSQADASGTYTIGGVEKDINYAGFYLREDDEVVDIVLSPSELTPKGNLMFTEDAYIEIHMPLEFLGQELNMASDELEAENGEYLILGINDANVPLYDYYYNNPTEGTIKVSQNGDGLDVEIAGMELSDGSAFSCSATVSEEYNEEYDYVAGLTGDSNFEVPGHSDTFSGTEAYIESWGDYYEIGLNNALVDLYSYSDNVDKRLEISFETLYSAASLPSGTYTFADEEGEMVDKSFGYARISLYSADSPTPESVSVTGGTVTITHADGELSVTFNGITTDHDVITTLTGTYTGKYFYSDETEDSLPPSGSSLNKAARKGFNGAVKQHKRSF